MTPQARDFTQEERDKLAEKGHAMPDGSFPIVTREDLENAIQAIGRAKDPEAVKRHIKKRARELGLEELIPEGWNSVDPEKLRDRLKRPVSRLQNGRTDWYRIENKADSSGPPKIYIYDEIGYFGHTAKGFTDDLNAIDSSELTLHVNSPGGDIFDGLAIYQALKSHKAQVTVVVDGLAASIASVIAMAGDRVVMAPKATMMIHDGWSMSVGNAAEMRKMADLLDKQSDIIASVYADRSGQPADFWRNQMHEDSWYNAQEAVAAGLADEIEGQVPKKDDQFDLSVYAHAGREQAPAPAIKPPAEPVVVKDEVTPVATVEKPEEPKPFTWDFAAFKNALQSGVSQ